MEEEESKAKKIKRIIYRFQLSGFSCCPKYLSIIHSDDSNIGDNHGTIMAREIATKV